MFQPSWTENPQKTWTCSESIRRFTGTEH
jgi:hypothetical protein